MAASFHLQHGVSEPAGCDVGGDDGGEKVHVIAYDATERTLITKGQHGAVRRDGSDGPRAGGFEHDHPRGRRDFPRDTCASRRRSGCRARGNSTHPARSGRNAGWGNNRSAACMAIRSASTPAIPRARGAISPASRVREISSRASSSAHIRPRSTARIAEVISSTGSRYAISEDGALHAEKFFRTCTEECATTRPAFRWRQLCALARVTASEFGRPAAGVAEAKELLKVS